MRKLILGCGYLGSRVAGVWLRQGHEVWALTRSSDRASEFQRHNIQPVVGDVTDPASLTDLPEADTVLYAVGYDRSTEKSRQEVYVDGLENVLQRVAPRTRRLLYVSSISVYGQTHGEWVDESSPCDPVRPNGRVCLEAEQRVWDHFPPAETAKERGASVLRLAGIYGPGRLLSRVETLQAGHSLSGNPDAWLNLIHVDDAVAAVLACEDRGLRGRTYLVCDDRPITRRDYYATLAGLVEAPPPTFDTSQEGGTRTVGLNKRCCNSRLRQELGVELTCPTIEQGLPQAIAGG